MINLPQLIRWLGPEGAIAGLTASDLTIAELLELTDERAAFPQKLKRAELIRRIVVDERGRHNKRPEDLLQMDSQELLKYFSEVRATRSEILELLVSLDIRPGSAARHNLAEFAAREISDIGMYQRVAQGKHKNSDR